MYKLKPSGRRLEKQNLMREETAPEETPVASDNPGCCEKCGQEVDMRFTRIGSDEDLCIDCFFK